MYGMVNQAIKDLVLSKFGEEAWDKICIKANVSTEDFVFMQYYSDKLTYDLVGAASEQLSLPPYVILNEFGKHWVLFTAKEGYGMLMDLFGSDFKTCLMNLNNLHARMGMTMPDLTPPRFNFSEIDEKTYTIDYYSKRSGLAPMVSGLLEGLALKYGVKAKVEHLENTNGDATSSFKITLLE